MGGRCERFILGPEKEKMILLYFSFFLKKKKEKFKAGRFLPTFAIFRKIYSKRTKALAQIFSENDIHPDTASRPAKSHARLRNIT